MFKHSPKFDFKHTYLIQKLTKNEHHAPRTVGTVVAGQLYWIVLGVQVRELLHVWAD